MVGGTVVRKILELKDGGRSIRSIAGELSLSRNTVRRYLRAERLPNRKKRPPRATKVDPFHEHLALRWAQGVTNAVVLLREIRTQGYKGSYSGLKRYLSPWRAAKTNPVKLTVRFETQPGEQAQVDFGKFRYVTSDGTEHWVWAFVMVLGWSRAMYVEFIAKANLSAFIRCHLRAFEYLGGIPQHCLYDNTKLVVIARDEHNQPVWNEGFLEFALTLGFTPKACKPYRARTKGKVERGVGYVEGNFWVAAEFTTLGDLNRQGLHWLDSVANQRVHGTTHEKPAARLQVERGVLKPMPNVQTWWPYLYEPRRVNIDGYFSYEGSLYAAPWKYAGGVVQVLVEAQVLKIFAGDELVAQHPRAKLPGERVGVPGAPLSTRTPRPERGTSRTKTALQLPLPHTEVQARPLQQYAELLIAGGAEWPSGHSGGAATRGER